MEAIGLGANVVAFIVIASQLSRALYTTLSSIKDGPKNVQGISNHLLQLHGVLEQLRHSPFVRYDTALAGHVELCVSDLESLAESVQKLQFTPGERKRGKIWKRFRSFFDERKLDCIRKQIVTHTSTLNFRLGILHSNTTYELLSSTRAVEQSVNGLKWDVENQAKSFTTELAIFHDTFHTRQESLQNGLESLHITIGDMLSVSHKSADNILKLLAEAKGNITNPNQNAFEQGTLEDDATEQDDHMSRGANTQDNPGPDPGLILSIARLCSLLKEKRKAFDRDSEGDTQAYEIIEDLEVLVGSMQKYGNIATTQTYEVSSTGTQNLLDQITICRNLDHFRRSFGLYKILVNQEAQEKDNITSTAVRQTRTHTRVSLRGLGALSFTITRRAQASAAGGGNPTGTDCTSCTMVISFVPQDPRQFAMIVASTTESRVAHGSTNMISRLEVNRVLPAGSRVFTIVKNGHLKELQAMLQEGKATLRDHDEYGANLLFYAAFSRRVEMCKFLLENGADVDHVSSAHGLGGWLYNDTRPRYVLELNMMFGEVGPKTFESCEMDSCRRLILEAGADPSATTLTSHKVTPSFIEWATSSGHPETLQLIWGVGLGRLFVDINDPLPTGMPPLLHSSTGFSGDRAVEGLCILLDAGANINVRDDQGQSCLHRCLRNVWVPLKSKWITKHVDILQLLVMRGADVYARDHLGQSVCEVAYSDKDFQYGKRGSYIGDLWDYVLHSCGYDIAEFRRNNQRRSNYTENYTRQDFETLWKGREGQCPYWNDELWLPEAGWCYSVRIDETQDGSAQTIDVTESDNFGELEGPTSIESMDEVGTLWGNRSRQDQSSLGITEAIDQNEWCSAFGSSKMGYRSNIEDVEFPGVFENPWL
ncbi:ankyrin [Xylariaceae sp. FL1651]|nr:ankyrin [Xylariaceae sp. FL1651]